MRRVILGLIVCWMGCGSPVADGGECSSDDDCKGDRICEGGECVSPDGGGSPQAGAGGESGQSRLPEDNDAAPAAGEFGAQCRSSSECQEELCLFRTAADIDTGRGFCGSYCDAVSECPTNYDCVVLNGAARKGCVPEDRLGKCKSACDDYSFFGCTDSAAVTACQAACEEASVQERLAFADCAESEAFDCGGTSCLEAFGVTVAVAGPDCVEDVEATQYCGGFMVTGFICGNNASPDDGEFAYCQLEGAEGGQSLHCCFQ